MEGCSYVVVSIVWEALVKLILYRNSLQPNVFLVKRDLSLMSSFGRPRYERNDLYNIYNIWNILNERYMTLRISNFAAHQVCNTITSSVRVLILFCLVY